MVEKALADLNVSTDEACLVGDSQADLEAAQQAGVKAVLVSFGYSGDLDVLNSGADMVIDRLSEVLTYDT